MWKILALSTFFNLSIFCSPSGAMETSSLSALNTPHEEFFKPLKNSSIYSGPEKHMSPSFDTLKKKTRQKKIQRLTEPPHPLKPFYALADWPTSLTNIDLKGLEKLHAHCLWMVEYEDMVTEHPNIWSKRLLSIESLLQLAQEVAEKKYLKKETDICSPFPSLEEGSFYKIRRIYINTKNPRYLDLHGISSAKEAKNKILNFTRIAKSRKKKQVIVITGKGNHPSKQGDRGVLFKAFPKWARENKNIASFQARENGGSYTLSLTSPSRTRLAFELSQELQWYLKRGNYTRQSNFKGVTQEKEFNKISILKEKTPSYRTEAELKRPSKKVKKMKRQLKKPTLGDFMPSLRKRNKIIALSPLKLPKIDSRQRKKQLLTSTARPGRSARPARS